MVLQAEPGFGEVVKSVGQIGLVPTLFILALYLYKKRTDATIEHLQKQVDKLLEELFRRNSK